VLRLFPNIEIPGSMTNKLIKSHVLFNECPQGILNRIPFAPWYKYWATQGFPGREREWTEKTRPIHFPHLFTLILVTSQISQVSSSSLRCRQQWTKRAFESFSNFLSNSKIITYLFLKSCCWSTSKEINHPLCLWPTWNWPSRPHTNQDSWVNSHLVRKALISLS
jgi:hypothetical protein